jgi:hypothetical protein
MPCSHPDHASRLTSQTPPEAPRTHHTPFLLTNRIKTTYYQITSQPTKNCRLFTCSATLKSMRVLQGMGKTYGLHAHSSTATIPNHGPRVRQQGD